MSRRVSGGAGVTALVSGGHFLSHLYFLAFPPLFPILATEFEATVTRLALGVSLVYLALFVFQIPAGELVDRVGAKRVLVGGLFVTGVSIVLVGFADSYPAFLALAFLSGVGQSPFHPADYALLDASGDESGEGKRFSVHSFGGFVGFAAAPLVVTTLAAVADWHVALYVIGAVGVAYAGLLALALAPVHRAQLADAETPAADEGGNGSVFGSVALLKRPLVAGMFGYFLVLTLADTGIQTFTTAFAVQGLDLSAAIGNTALTAFMAVTAVFVLVGGWFADRYDPHRIIVLSLSWSALVLWVGLAAGLGRLSLVAVWGAAGLGFGLTLPARDRITNALSAAADTGKSCGIVYTGLPLGGVLAPVLIGAVITAADTAMGLAAVGVCFLLTAVIVVGLALYERSQSAGVRDAAAH